MPFIWVQIVNNGVHQYPNQNHQVDDGELGALEDYQATDFISIFQKVKLALNLLVTFSMTNYFSTFPKDIKKLLPRRQRVGYELLLSSCQPNIELVSSINKVRSFECDKKTVKAMIRLGLDKN